MCFISLGKDNVAIVCIEAVNQFTIQFYNNFFPDKVIQKATTTSKTKALDVNYKI